MPDKPNLKDVLSSMTLMDVIDEDDQANPQSMYDRASDLVKRHFDCPPNSVIEQRDLLALGWLAHITHVLAIESTEDSDSEEYKDAIATCISVVNAAYHIGRESQKD